MRTDIQLFVSLLLGHAIPMALGFLSHVARLRITRVQGLWVSASLLIGSFLLIAMGIDPYHWASYLFVISLVTSGALLGMMKRKSKSG